MAQDNRTLEERIRDCRSASELQDLMASQNQSQRFVRQADGFTETVTVTRCNQPENGTTVQQAAPSQAPHAADNGMLIEVWESPDGRIRSVDAFSPSGLDQLTQTIRTLGWKRIR
jgi:hypothetical protein